MTGYSDASTATTLSSPRLPPSPKRMFALVSARPTQASNGQCRSEPRTGKRIARTNARPSGTAVTRIEKVAQINAILADLDDGKTVFYKDIGKEFLDQHGGLSGEIMPDYLHLSARGYDIWGKAIKGDLEKLVK